MLTKEQAFDLIADPAVRIDISDMGDEVMVSVNACDHVALGYSVMGKRGRLLEILSQISHTCTRPAESHE